MGEVIEMHTPEVKQEKKLSYEELENVANSLYVRLQQADMTNMFKRLDYLFKVVENKNNFPSSFTTQCVDEIVNIMTISTEETKEV
jgi:hypothetical protein